jgi:hypothetical protein
MNSSIVRRAKAARRFGFVVVLAGFVPVAQFVAQSVPGSVGAVAMLAQFHGWTALGAALAGFAVMMLGARIARRQMAVLASAARHREDSLRRARHYQDGERIEPFIGPGLPGTVQAALSRSSVMRST